MTESGKGKKFVSRGARKDVVYSSPTGAWELDRIGGKDPAFEYQMMRADEVRDRQFSKEVNNHRTGETRRVSGWEVCKYADGIASLGAGRPDMGAPIDDVVTQGPHVLMRIPAEDYELLQIQQSLRTDMFEQRLIRGHVKDIEKSDKKGTYYEELPSKIESAF